MSGNAWDPSLLSADSVASVKYNLLPPTEPLSPLYFTPPLSLCPLVASAGCSNSHFEDRDALTFVFAPPLFYN